MNLINVSLVVTVPSKSKSTSFLFIRIFVRVHPDTGEYEPSANVDNNVEADNPANDRKKYKFIFEQYARWRSAFFLYECYLQISHNARDHKYCGCEQIVAVKSFRYLCRHGIHDVRHNDHRRKQRNARVNKFEVVGLRRFPDNATGLCLD